MKPHGVTIQMKASEQYFPVVLFVMLYKVVILSLWMKSYRVTIQMKATEQYFPVVLFIVLYKVVLTFESVDKIPWREGLKRILFQGDLVLSRGIKTVRGTIV